MILSAMVGMYANSHIADKTTLKNNTAKNNTNTSIAVSNGDEPTSNTGNTVTTSHTEDDDNDDDSEDKETEKSDSNEEDYQEDTSNDEYYYSTSEGNYLSADDYYVSDMGFVISKNRPQTWSI